MGQISVKLIGEQSDLDPLASELSKYGFTASLFRDFDDAMESHQVDPAQVFVLTASQLSQTHANELKRANPQPGMVLYVKDKIPNLAKILNPYLIYADSKVEDIAWTLEKALFSSRSLRRLEAIRSNHQSPINLESNPALQFITEVMKKCTLVDDYQDLLSVTAPVSPLLSFHDSTLVSLDGKGVPMQAWHLSLGSKSSPISIPITSNKSVFSLFKEGESKCLLSSDSLGAPLLDSFTGKSWGSCLGLRFSASNIPSKENLPKSALILLFRRELYPFEEKDAWLLDAAHASLTLALEKVIMLKTINQASKEWRATFDSVSEPLSVVDSTYSIFKANKSFATLVGQDIKKLKGRKCYSLLASRRSPCVGCPIDHQGSVSLGSRITGSGPEKKDLLAWSYEVAVGKDNYHFQFYRNIAKENALQSALIQSEKMSALGKLLGAIAHEINNPLAGALATSQLLIKEMEAENPIDQEALEEIKAIQDAASRSKKIIEDLLGFTSATVQDKKDSIVEEIVQTVVALARSALAKIKVERDLQANLPAIRASQSMLQQVLFNLVTNAAHAMEAGGELRIKAQKSQRNGFIELSISDTGPGIPEADLPVIFDPFFTRKKEGMGTGLGLSIVKNLVGKMGGEISVRSEVGKGTSFLLSLPSVQTTIS